MAIEQGTAVPSPRIDLLPSADLPDLRLSRAFKAWKVFNTEHLFQMKSIGSLQPFEITLLTNDLSHAIQQAISVDNINHPNIHASSDKLARFTNLISGDGNRVVFMRHGEQSPPEWIFSIADPGLRKIRMMQDPFNRDDFLTNQGLVNVFVTTLGLLYVLELTGKSLHVLSSENRRAKEVGEIISTIVPDATLSTLDGLTSITYKDERDIPPATMENLLEELPSGLMPWDPQLVDKWCKPAKNGRNQSEVIIETMGELMKKGTASKGNELFLILTHSQQLAEVLRIAGSKLVNRNFRVPELSMLVPTTEGELITFRKGILIEDDVIQKAKNIRKVLETLGADYEWYKIRREEFRTDQKIPFLVTPKPLYLSTEESAEVLRIGKDIVDFMFATNDLYKSEPDVKELLDRGKPRVFQSAGQPRYLFIRPDLLITGQGFSVCEIETSPFGLGLAELLNRAYRFAGFDTMVQDGTLSNFLSSNTPPQGTIVYSQKTCSYAGQLEFLAKEVLSGTDRRWEAKEAYMISHQEAENLYRGFYQNEYFEDLFVNNLIQVLFENGTADTVIPSFTPHMEEKALLALIWDKRWEPFFVKQLGKTSFQHLQKIIPPTWTIGQEEYFAPGLPSGFQSSEALASLPKSKRKFVLKKSGFSSGSSWAEGVTFLQEKSTEKARALLAKAAQEDQFLYIVQEFRSAQECQLTYNVDANMLGEMQARIRLTPYFSMTGENKGDLIAIKATGCENTNYIHASTGSINTAVAKLS